MALEQDRRYPGHHQGQLVIQLPQLLERDEQLGDSVSDIDARPPGHRQHLKQGPGGF